MQVAIIGASGAIGRSVAEAYHRAGERVRLVGRQAVPLEALASTGDEVVTADVSTLAGCRAAVAGMDAAVYSFGLPYSDRAFAAYPEMMQHFLAAVRGAGLKRVLLITNIYAYGMAQSAQVAEDHPRVPCSVKGEWRKRQEDIFLAASGNGPECISLRLPDFYGPRVATSMLYGVAKAAAAGRTGLLLSPADQPHEFGFTPDVGPVVRDLLRHQGAVAGPYNLAGAGVISLRGLAELMYQAAGRPPRLRVLPVWQQSLLGLVVPALREIATMRYLLKHPVLLDDSKLRTLLPGLRKTSYADGARATVAAAGKTKAS
ncbi:NAD(P)H-binding protein [Aestuariivirga sp.]|jgi:nucleoside-diphosphate-sugar epimerase|uniref:NAD(P)H-binding protein n=1 Tax=Aestuariivirga sp. TaxID=2650926 RepID=UPI003783CA30